MVREVVIGEIIDASYGKSRGHTGRRERRWAGKIRCACLDFFPLVKGRGGFKIFLGRQLWGNREDGIVGVSLQGAVEHDKGVIGAIRRPPKNIVDADEGEKS